MIKKSLIALCFLLVSFQNSFAVLDSMKVMNWNLLNFSGTDTSRVHYYRTVISSVSPDVFICQEITGTAANKVLFRQVFEVFAPGIYDTVTFVSSFDSSNLLFFKKSKASFVSNKAIHTELRDINEFKMYVNFIQDTVRFFSLHLKSSNTAPDEAQRGREIDSLRKYTNSLPSGKFFIVSGDFNIYKSTEVAYTKLLAAGGNDGALFDPVSGMTGTWNNASYAHYHTQSPRLRSFGGGASGGMDDRFDLLLSSNACRDTVTGKFYWVRSKYTAYGNDGNHYNDSINKQPNTAVSVPVADAIHYGSDHIPIIATFGMSNPALPVNLVTFVSVVNLNNVQLKWSTASEQNNSGFEIERKSNSDWQRIGLVKGSGTSYISNSYVYLDKALQSGYYSYRLKQIDLNGNYEYFYLSSDVHIGTPEKFALEQNYPNPFNPVTTVNFTLPEENFVVLKIYDLNGREIYNAVNEKKAAGYYSVTINASALPSGAYFYRLSAGKFSSIRKMVLLK